MISELTQNPFEFQDRVLHVASGQKADVLRIVKEVGVRVEWFTGASAIRPYSETEMPDFSNPSTWILATHTAEDAQVIQAALDQE